MGTTKFFARFARAPPPHQLFMSDPPPRQNPASAPANHSKTSTEPLELGTTLFKNNIVLIFIPHTQCTLTLTITVQSCDVPSPLGNPPKYAVYLLTLALDDLTEDGALAPSHSPSTFFSALSCLRRFCGILTSLVRHYSSQTYPALKGICVILKTLEVLAED